MSDCAKHEGHAHTHGPGCGHKTIEHEGHRDYLHEGHLHHVHGDHLEAEAAECSGMEAGGPVLAEAQECQDHLWP